MRLVIKPSQTQKGKQELSVRSRESCRTVAGWQMLPRGFPHPAELVSSQQLTPRAIPDSALIAVEECFMSCLALPRSPGHRSVNWNRLCVVYLHGRSSRIYHLVLFMYITIQMGGFVVYEKGAQRNIKMYLHP